MKKNVAILSQVPPGATIDVIAEWNQPVIWNHSRQLFRCRSGNSYDQLLLGCLQTNGVTENKMEYGLFYENGDQVNYNEQLQISEKDKNIYCGKDFIYNSLRLEKFDISFSYANARQTIHTRRDESIHSALEKCLHVDVAI